MTYSIVAFDPTTQMTGVAVATKHLAVGALVPHAKAAVGAIATQGQTNPLLGIYGLQLLEQRLKRESNVDKISVEDIIDLLLKDDEDCDRRQFHLVDPNGHTAAWTGENCVRKEYYQSFRQSMPTQRSRTTEPICLSAAVWSSTTKTTVEREALQVLP